MGISFGKGVRFIINEIKSCLKFIGVGNGVQTAPMGGIKGQLSSLHGAL